MTTLAMEEHYQAYFAWKAQGFKNQWCWHVDAHLDIGKTDLGEERLERLRDCLDAETARRKGLLGNSYVPWGGLHCGNYLYPAIREGIVDRLTWVIPPDLPEGGLLAWAHRHLNGWFELELQEYASLKVEGERLVGSLLGIPVEIGTLESLTLPTEPVLMDIDLDYFLTEEGTPWWDSESFQERVASVPVLYRTVAYSVLGGFTPNEQRRLAEAFNLPADGYESSHLDHLAGLVRCHKYQQAVDLEMPTSLRDNLETRFLKASSLQALERSKDAVEVWLAMLSDPDLPRGGQAYLHGVCAELLNSTGQADEALSHSQLAQKLEPENALHYFNEAVAREHLGEWRRSEKALRKAIKLSEHLLFGLRARYALSRVYSHTGKDGLANMELKKLAQLDVTGQYRPATMLAR